MKVMRIDLFFGMLCVLATTIYAPREEAHTDIFPDQGEIPKEHVKPDSFVQRLRNGGWRNLISMFRKKLTTSLQKSVPQSPVDVQVDEDPQLTTKEAELIDKLVKEKESSLRNDQRTLSRDEQEKSETFRFALTKMAQQQRTIDNALQKIGTEDPALLKDIEERDKTKRKYLETVVQKESPEQQTKLQELSSTLKEQQDLLLRKLNELLNKQVAALLKAQEALIVKALEKKQIASIDDATNDTTGFANVYKRYWDRTKTKLEQIDERATNNGNFSVLQARLTLDDELMQKLNDYTDTIIQEINRNERSSSAARNWKRLDTFDAQLLATKKEADQLEATWRAMTSDQQASKAGKKFKTLFDQLQTLDSTTMLITQKAALLQERSLWSFSFSYPEGSFKRIISEMKVALKQMKQVS